MKNKNLEKISKEQLIESYLRCLTDIQEFNNYTDLQMARLLLEHSLSYLKLHLKDHNKEILVPLDELMKNLKNIYDKQLPLDFENEKK